MAIRGRKPKADGEKVTRHDLTHGWIEVPDVAYGGAAELGKHPESRRKWAAGTGAWWMAISTMPHCILWSPSQWQFALTTALIYDRWLRGDNARAGELRQREAILGTTLDARRDLRIRYVNPLGFTEVPEDGAGDEQDDRMTNFEAERRRRLLSAE